MPQEQRTDTLEQQRMAREERVMRLYFLHIYTLNTVSRRRRQFEKVTLPQVPQEPIEF